MTVMLLLLAAWGMGASAGNAVAVSGAERMRVLSDGAALAGGMLFFPGTVICLSRWGAFDGLLYGLRSAGNMLLPGRRQQPLSFGDYTQVRRNKPGNTESVLLISGGILLLSAALLAVLYCSIT